MDDNDSKLVSERKNLQTGTVIQVFDNRDLALDTQSSDGRWETLCVDHGFVMGFETKSLAVSFAASPSEWCSKCDVKLLAAQFDRDINWLNQ